MVFIEDDDVWAEETARTCPTCNIEMVRYWTVLSASDDDSLFGDELLVLANMDAINAKYGVDSW